MAMDDIPAFKAFMLDLMAEGYRRGVPNADCWADKEIVANDRCPACGLRKVFVPLLRVGPHTYRAFSACMACDTAYEF